MRTPFIVALAVPSLLGEERKIPVSCSADSNQLELLLTAIRANVCSVLHRQHGRGSRNRFIPAPPATSAAESTFELACQESGGEVSADSSEDESLQPRTSPYRGTHQYTFPRFGASPETAVDMRPPQEFVWQPGQWQSHRPESQSSPFARTTISQQQQPASPSEQDQRPDEPTWIDQLARSMDGLAVRSDPPARLSPQPVSALQQAPTPSGAQETRWIDELARSMGELVVQGQQQPARPLLLPFSSPPHDQVQSRRQHTDSMNDFDRGMNVLGAQWLAQSARQAQHPRPVFGQIRPAEPRNIFAPRPRVIPARPRPPAAPAVSLNKLAEDASVLLELFSQRPDDNDNITEEHETMITSAAAGISVIQAQLRQRAARGNQDIESPEVLSRDADCIICYSKCADIVFMPCKHLVVCTVRIPWARR